MGGGWGEDDLGLGGAGAAEEGKEGGWDAEEVAGGSEGGEGGWEMEDLDIPAEVGSGGVAGWVGCGGGGM